MKVAALLSAFDATDVSDDACKHGNSLCVTNALVKLHPVWAPHPRIGKPPAVMRRAEAVQPNVAQGGLSPSNQYGRAIEQQPIDKVFLQKGGGCLCAPLDHQEISLRSEEHTSELQSLMRTSYAVLCLKKKKQK